LSFSLESFRIERQADTHEVAGESLGEVFPVCDYWRETGCSGSIIRFYAEMPTLPHVGETP